MNRRLPWLVSLPLMAVGCLGAHSVAYRLVEPVAPDADHGHVALTPLVLASGVALVVVAALRSVVAGRTQTGAPACLFAFLPPLAFTLQEHLERALQHDAPTLETALEPVFLVGLGLQLPFALCALVLTRSLLRVAGAAGALLCRQPALRLRPPIVMRPAFALHAPRLPTLASAHAGRAPPLLV